MYTYGESKPIKLTILGDTNTGKTASFQTFLNNKFTPNTKNIKVAEKCFGYLDLKNAKTPNQKIEIQIYDSRSTHNRNALDRASYIGTDCFIVFFDVNDEKTFENAVNFWYDEILRYGSARSVAVPTNKSKMKRSHSAPFLNQIQSGVKSKTKANISTPKPYNTPILLIGNKLDLFYDILPSIKASPKDGRPMSSIDYTDFNLFRKYHTKKIKSKKHIMDINYTSALDATTVREAFSLGAYYGYLHASGLYRGKETYFSKSAADRRPLKRNRGKSSACNIL